MKVFVGLNTPLGFLLSQFKYLLFLYQLLQLRSCLLDVERIGTIVFHRLKWQIIIRHAWRIIYILWAR